MTCMPAPIETTSVGPAMPVVKHTAPDSPPERVGKHDNFDKSVLYALIRYRL
jgi:hypothetical protein